ncbi:hypothetical protein [Bacillus sinesaloumensis]|uniref:hypothetical protein n=1 Tax=Litchfieldia sinesaloumensis TaxID=1926280 RepID=UPI0009883914|nr:hypothetical protein [Bacillus sinesaloumensis]
MTYQFLELDESFEEQLLRLASRTNTGSDLFYVDRSPHFFRLSDEFGMTKHFGLFRENELIGCVAVSQQQRVIDGTCERVFYLNDLRLHPDYHRTFAYYRLAENLLSFYRNEDTVKWMFSTVLDSNTNKSSMIKGNQLLPGGVEIGKTTHIGVPMFMNYRKHKQKSYNEHLSVIEIDGEEAWQVYQKRMTFKSFAPCDKDLFMKENGVFLVIRNDRKEDLAVCKLVDQSDARKLRLSDKLPIAFKLVNFLCRGVVCPPLPDKGDLFRHGYMAYFMAKENPLRYRDEFIAYIQKTYKHRFTYLFYGASAEDSQRYRSNLLTIKLSSTTYAYGDIPISLAMDFHELTLI